MSLRLMALTLFAFICSPVRADDDVQTFVLPEDGAWAKYRMSSTRTRGDRMLRDEMEITLSSVGKETRDGTACRWLELVSVDKDPNGKELKGIINVLIPDAAFQGERHEVQSLLDGKYRRPGNPNATKVHWESASDSPLSIVIPGPLEDRKELDARTLRTQT